VRFRLWLSETCEWALTMPRLCRCSWAIPKTGDFRGYEGDLPGEIARRAGFRLSYRRALWSAIVSELMTGEVDLICQLPCAQVVTLASRVFMKSKIA
jgi:ABC-type amino acid transport substrate-binding protein